MEAKAGLCADSRDFTLAVNAASSGPFLQAPNSAARHTAMATVINCNDFLSCLSLTSFGLEKRQIHSAGNRPTTVSF
jgi:hypothetical protein